MKKRLSIVSPTQLSQMLSNNPALFSIPALAPLNYAIQQLKQQTQAKKCNCKGPTPNNPLIQMKAQMEAILSNMAPSDYLSMKSILNIEVKRFLDGSISAFDSPQEPDEIHDMLL